MVVQRDRRAPYASTGSIKTVIEKNRDKGLQDISLERLQRIGITEALAPRTLHALIFLGFYGEDGRVTPEFDALRHLQQHEYKPALAELLKGAYASILENVNLATATPLDVENAFRGFEPTGQISRMVQLFMGLMAYVGLMPEPKRRAATVGRPPKTPATQPSSGRGPSQAAGVQPESERPAEHLPQEPPKRPDGSAGERRDISFGSAGSVTVLVSVQWLELSDDKFTKLRKLIKEMEALGASGSDRDERVEVSP